MEGGAGREVQTSNADDISSVSKIGGVQSLLGLESPIMQGRHRLAVAAMLGAATFGVLEAIQSVARADHSFSEPMSVYAAGPYGFVQTVAFLVLAVGSAAVCAAIGLPQPRPPDWQVARGLIVVWSVGVSLAAAFRIDGSGSTAAQVHAAASMLSFLTVLAAMFFFTRATRQVPAWYSFGKVSSALASVAALAFVVAGATQPSIVFGVAQRVFLGAVVAWLVAVVLEATSRPGREHREASSCAGRIQRGRADPARWASRSRRELARCPRSGHPAVLRSDRRAGHHAQSLRKRVSPR